jgi:hypothetical protein
VPAKAFNKTLDTETIGKLADEIGGLKREQREKEGPNSELVRRHSAGREHVDQLTAQFVSSRPNMLMIDASERRN